jgi:hypothetical protein
MPKSFIPFSVVRYNKYMLFPLMNLKLISLFPLQNIILGYLAIFQELSIQ